MFLSKLNKNYNNIADDFSISRENLFWPKEFDYFLSFLDKNKKYKVLDLGCANARLYKYLKKHLKDFEYVGVDQSEKLINIAKKQYPDLIFYNLDLLNDDLLKIGKFDVVFSIAMFHHLDKDKMDLGVQRIYDLLKDENSFLFLTTWNLFNLKNKKNIWHFWKDRIFLSNKQFFNKYQLNKKELNSIFEVLTIWQRNNKNKEVLYYFAFLKYFLKKIFKRNKFKILDIQYFKKNLFNAKNILLVAKKK